MPAQQQKGNSATIPGASTAQLHSDQPAYDTSQSGTAVVPWADLLAQM